MARIRSISFPLRQFTSSPASDEQRVWPVKNDAPPHGVHDTGMVKVGDGGGKPFKQHAPTHDSGQVKFGDSGGMPFARYPAQDALKVKIGSGGGIPFARHPAVKDSKVKIGGGGGMPFARY